MVNIERSNVLGVILAGGKSSRMGTDKAQLSFAGNSMLTHTKQLLSQANVQNIVVSGKDYQCPDIIENAGPLGGIHSVIKAYRPSAILVLPIDMPLMQPKLLEQLINTGQLTQQAVHFQQYEFPLYMPINAFSEQFFNQAFSQFSGKGPSIKSLLAAIPSKQLSVKHHQAFINTNTPEHWQKALHLQAQNSKESYVS